MALLVAMLFLMITNLFEKKAVNQTSVVFPKDTLYTVAYFNGRKLFHENCSVCHSLNHYDVSSVLGVKNRVADKQLLIQWIKNSNSVLKTGEPYFTNLFRESNNVMMPDFPQLSDKQIEDILEYLRQFNEIKSHKTE